MTTNEAKSDAIRKAYGEHWDKVKNHVNEIGWCNFKNLFGEAGNGIGLEGIELQVLDNYHPVFCYYKRPKSLAGIEDNNGWIRIESEADLPKEEGNYWTADKNDRIVMRFFISSNECIAYWKTLITHYLPIIKPKPPIY